MHGNTKSRRDNARRVVKSAGYKSGGAADEAQDKSLVAKMIHKHERHDHKGEPLTKFAHGGPVMGKPSKKRADRSPRKGKVTVNVINTHPGMAPALPPRPVTPVPSMGPTAPVPPRPMGPPMPMAGIGARPMAKRGGKMKRGGSVKVPVPMDAGSGGAKGRMEKIKLYGAKP